MDGMKMFALLSAILLVAGCEFQERSATLPDVSLSTWSQASADPVYGPVEIQWIVAGGSPNNTGSAVWSIDAQFQVTASDTSVHGLHLHRSDYYGSLITHFYIDYLDIGGREAVDVILADWRM